MSERKYTRWKKCLICEDFVKLMFPEDSKNLLLIYEPVEEMSNKSKNWKKRQLGYIHRSCLKKVVPARLVHIKEKENKNEVVSGI